MTRCRDVHTCGTVNAASNTSSCQNLISITNANNSGVMGYGKLNARGGDVVLNSFPTRWLRRHDVRQIMVGPGERCEYVTAEASRIPAVSRSPIRQTSLCTKSPSRIHQTSTSPSTPSTASRPGTSRLLRRSPRETRTASTPETPPTSRSRTPGSPMVTTT